MQGVKLDTPRTMPAIAQMAGMSTRNMRKHLLRLHRQEGDSLLVRVGGRWMVTLASLRRVWPDFAKRLATPDDVRELVGEQMRQHQRHKSLVETVRRQGADLAKLKLEIASFRINAHAWFTRDEVPEIPRESGTLPVANTDGARSKRDQVDPKLQLCI